MTPEGGQFELEALIEEGSYGTVFEYFDKSDGKRKVYHQSQSFVNWLFKSYELLSMVPEIIYIIIIEYLSHLYTM